MASYFKELVFLLTVVISTFGFGSPLDNTLSSLTVSSPHTKSKISHSDNENVLNRKSRSVVKPNIYDMLVQVNVTDRFAHATVVSKVKNLSGKPQETEFTFVLPESAFISGFIMQIRGKNYTAYVQEKQEAENTYKEAVSKGQGAAHVATRDSNVFTVSVNVEPESRAIFYLTYEELLQRQDGKYELVVNLKPGQPVQELAIEVSIAESKPIKNLRVLPLRSGNEITSENKELDPQAIIKKYRDIKRTSVVFNPDIDRQKLLAKLIGKDSENGIDGQFVIQYDVERDNAGGEIFQRDGYFTHFFAPTNLPLVSKYVVFILDTSGSMYGNRIKKLKEAMDVILRQLRKDDYFSLVTFNSEAKVLLLNTARVREETDHQRSLTANESTYLATSSNIDEAIRIVYSLVASGQTNIFSALKRGLELVETAKQSLPNSQSSQPMIILLTDGDPSSGLTNKDQIINEVTNLNTGARKSLIYTLGFGIGTDKVFLKKLALKNGGLSKHIYEANDSTQQLQFFFKSVSSPVLTNVNFKYPSCAKEYTETNHPVAFDGSEIVVAGKCDGGFLEKPKVLARGKTETKTLIPVNEVPEGQLQRLWAYLRVKDLLKKMETADNGTEFKKQALELALKYSFVTPVSSLVVVKPNKTVTGNIQSDLAFKPGEAAPGPLKKRHFGTLSLPEIYNTLPWLGRHTYLNGSYVEPPGGYLLGLNTTLNDVVDCPMTLLNQTGHCKLLTACPEIHSYLKTVDDFVKYFCPLKEYGGVCCPINMNDDRVHDTGRLSIAQL